MRWVNRLLYNNDKQAIALLYAGVKVTSLQAIRGEEMVFQLLTYRQKWLNKIQTSDPKDISYGQN